MLPVRKADLFSFCAADPTLPWLNIKTGILGPLDSRLSLPGAVGVDLSVAAQVRATAAVDSAVLGNVEMPMVKVLAPLPSRTTLSQLLEAAGSNYQSQMLVSRTYFSVI